MYSEDKSMKHEAQANKNQQIKLYAELVDKPYYLMKLKREESNKTFSKQ
jgi:hypothetical protein